MSKPKLIGITGGIGSGKSLVCKVFSTLGIPVYYADDRAKWLMHHDPVLKKGLIEAFGEESYDANGMLNRTYLASVVFSNEEKLKTMNGLVHPRVAADFKNWAKENKDKPYLLKEAALLFESGSYKSLDEVITVYASEEERIKRVLKRDTHRTENDIKAIIKKQFTEEQRQELASFVIDNSGEKMLIPQVLEVDGRLNG
ncbi:dephospho-CoA kinase [Flammeovirgaceae bacterium SG7u.111]|nr:dephospho-CoA kinase [Flammeovirgaceae bacterium SG7u.132]WPO35523.1 dephospho-CoA kinase [Flammeovirgaceae bacterium SG7u.111]